MLAEIGKFNIWISFGLTSYTILVLLYAQYIGFGSGPQAKSAMRRWVTSARNATVLTFPLLTAACLILIYLLVNDDYTVEYVQQVTSRETPLVLKVTSLWGGQAGSLLVWNLMVSGFLSVAWLRKWDEKELIPYAMLIGGFIQTFFLFLTAIPENPFALAEVIAPNGTGLSPLLRHPLMIIHPPMLYLGYTGFMIPYAFAMAALMAGRLDDGWIRTTRRWSLIAWLFLSLGLILGGRWAYDVLGWGGYWEWDPVENVAFLPWLTGTAFLHSVMIQEKRGMFRLWNVFLILLTFLLVIYGTLIVRTGLLSSVHAFANSEINWPFMIFMSFIFLYSAAWGIWRAPKLYSHNYLESLFSREAAFLANNFIILAITVIIFLFTNFTLLSEAFTGVERGIGPDTYNAATGPLFAILILLMGVAPLTMWYRTSIQRLGRESMWPAIAATVMVIGLVFGGMTRIGALVGLWVVFFSFLLTMLEYVRGVQARVRSKNEGWLIALGRLFQRNQRRYGGYLIHLGVLVMAFGIIGTEFFQADRQVFMELGDRATLGKYTIEFGGAEFVQGDDSASAIGTVRVFDEEGILLTTLFPRTNVFENGTGMTIPDARSNVAEDFYVILVNWEGVTTTSATIRMYLNPLVNWVWAGGIVFIIGTLIAAWPDPLDNKIALAEQRRFSFSAGD